MKRIVLSGLLAVSACSSAATTKVVADSQLYCAIATATGPLVVALATTDGIPVKVTGLAQANVTALCAIANAIPVSPPPNPAAAPVVTVATPAVTAPSN